MIANFYFRAEVDLCWTLQTKIWDMHASRRSIIEYYRVCIAKAALNETVCEDSHAEHMQFATAADSTPFRT